MSEQSAVHVPPPLCHGSGHHTALHQSATVGNSENIAALIQGGCAVDLRDRDGNTALHEVSWHGFSQCVKLLVKAGADVHIRNKAGNTALHLACQNAHAQTARLLMLGGSAPDTKNNVGDTCLHVAARYNNLTLVKILLSSLCSVTERNQGGNTALHVAAALNHKKTIELLLEAGTDGNVRNKVGKTALDKARDNNHRELSLLLAKAPQVQRLLRGRTIRKRRERLKAEHRTQSVTRIETLPEKDSSSLVEETPSSEQIESRAAIQPSNGDDIPKVKNDSRTKKEPLCDHGVDRSTQNGKTYQVYTLYRDKEGKVCQAPATGCYCQPLVKQLEEQLKATQGEMRLRIVSMEEQVKRRLGLMDRRNRHQIKVLDMLNQERAAADRKHVIDKMEQRAAQGREEALMTQAALRHELKRWCLSQVKDMDVHVPDEAQYFKLLPSPSVEQSVAEADHESFPLLSVLSGESSNSLATYVNILDNTTAEVVPSRGEGFSNSSSQSTIHDQGARLTPRQDHTHGRPHRKYFGELLRGSRHTGINADSTTTAEFIFDRPTEPTFSQERNNLHAMEVTQRFFETVSTQMERWCERKILEVEQQAEFRAQNDRKELLQRISTLEAELQTLRTSDKRLTVPDRDQCPRD
ncbi:ankyrin repeat domain-containing protein 6 [Brachyistius frenatus]|uniref:ankyrin repeat domain-containing protein 6 n=1 Tax=Brachyistius frenatus TaxID=100188 RepID=UPI0037E99553